MFTIRDLFEKECGDVVVDNELAKKISKFKISFIHKNEDHVEFFGGHLTGVKVVRFTDAMSDYWFEDILQVNGTYLREQLHELDAINPDFKVSSHEINQSFVWLVYKVNKSTKLSNEQKHACSSDILYIMLARFITSLLYSYFKYPANQEVAELTYNALNLKFQLKQCGSWNALIEERVASMLDKSNKRLPVLLNGGPDDLIIDLLNDAQGGVRSIVKNITEIHLDLNRRGERIYSTSMIVDHDGEGILKDQQHMVPMYSEYIRSVVGDVNSFMRDELMMVVEKLMSTMPPKLFKETLQWLSQSIRTIKSHDVEEVLNLIVVQCFSYLSDNRGILKNKSDLANIAVRLKGVMTSSRTTEEDLLKIRTMLESMVQQATGSKSKSIVAAVRTGVYLYVVLRMLTKNHYG